MREEKKSFLINLLIFAVVPAAVIAVGHLVTLGGYTDTAFEVTSIFVYLGVALAMTVLFRRGDGAAG